ncbi:MAG: ATP-binding protein [Actinomycetota bacterium]
MSERWLLVPGGGSRVRAMIVAVTSPAIALALALIVQPERELGAVSLFVLAVVIASVLGGIWAGVGSSVLGFVALTYFFTDPVHTFRITARDDLVGVGAFLVVALLVGWVVARAVRERDRASRREREARLLNYFATKVLSGEPLDQVLGDLAASLVDAVRLAACAIDVSAAGKRYEIRRTHPGVEVATTFEVPIAGGETSFGTLGVAPIQAGEGISVEDERLLEAAARQIAVVLERAALDAQVADARLAAEKSQTRAALFSSVTHDLRTPLSSIKAAVTSLLHEEVQLRDDQRAELLGTVLEETDRLNSLIGNILELAKVRAGALVPAKEPIALDEVVESVLHRMSGAFGRIRLRTILRDAPEVPADPVQIDQVLSNLLENAIRYSPPDGEVVVSLAPWRGGVQVRVVDQGPGIAPEARERVFEAFARGDAGGGSGLGLAIARAIVFAHGGRIWIEGAPGGGTAVAFERPARDAEPVAQETGAPEPRP